MNKYPGIYKVKNGFTRLYFNKSKYSDIDLGDFEWVEDINTNEHKSDTNITREYLTDTYGKVENKEHAEFIVKLAESAGFRSRLDYKGESCFFNFYNEGIFDFWTDEFSACALGEKLITIPLPPKDKSMESQKEWPAVGDEVLICKNVNLLELHRFNGKQCKVIGICEHDNKKVLTLSHKSCGLAAMNMGDWIKKPPTPEEELDAKLYDFFQCNSEEDLAKAIINGEIEGLEYKYD